VIFQNVSVTIGDIALKLLDPLIHELDHVTRLETDHVVVMRAIGQLEDCGATLEVVPGHESRLLELRQHAVDRGQTQFLAAIEQLAVDPFCAQMTVLGGFQHLEHLQSGRGYLEARVPQVLSFHDRFLRASGMIRAIMTQTRSPLYKLCRYILLAGASLWLVACIYHPDIQQGNRLEEDAVEQVEVGMSKSAVQFLLGTPTIADPFHADRWDYPYYLKRGRSPDIDRRWLVVWFESDRVVRIERDLSLDPST